MDGQVESGGLRVRVGQHPPGATFPEHAHASANVLYVLSGEFEQTVGSEIAACGPNWVLQKPAAVPHSDRLGARPTTILYVEVLEQRLGAVQAELGLLSEPAWWFAPECRASAVRLASTVRDASARPMVVEARALELLVDLAASRDREPRPSWDQALVLTSVLDADLGEPPALEQLGAREGLTRDQVLDLFRSHLGESPDEYVRRRRLEECSRLLATTDEPISAIAADLGFADQAHLTRAFREVFGRPPGAYRLLFRA